MIEQSQLDQLIVSLENERVEKTISVNRQDKFGEAICAFSNDLCNSRQPGYLIIGVNDDGSKARLEVTEKHIQTLLEFRTDGRIVPPPSISTKVFSYPEGEVLVAEVLPSSHPPVRFKGRVWVRVGPRKNVATEEEERRLSEKRSLFARSFDTLPCIGSNLKDISVEIFKTTYLPSAIDEETLLANHRDVKVQLASLKFYDLAKDCPTYAGILMFGTNPRFFLDGAYVQYVKFKGADEVSDVEYEKRFEGDLTTQMRVLNDFIKGQIVKMYQPDLGEDYQRNYPQSALQELLFNAVIHRDYQSNAPIKFYEFENRIEITNSGGLYGDARPENFPGTNDYRNPTLAEAAKTLGWVNKFNVGVKRAIAALKKNGNPDPEFLKDETTTFGVIIYKKQ